MADPMIITRGLAIPDPNFLHPLQDSWSYTDDFSSTDFQVRSAYQGIGRGLVVNVENADFDTHYLRSAPTPYGVFGAPWSATTGDAHQSVIYGLIAKTSGCATNENVLVQMDLEGLSSTGSTIGYRLATDPDDGDLGPTTETDWTFFHCREECDLETTIYSWRLRVRFQDTTAGGGYVHIGWVGVGILYDHTDAYTSDSTSNYRPSAGIGPKQTQFRWLTPQGSLNPKTLCLNRGAHSERVALDFLALTDDEKAMMERAEYWNKGAPDDDATAVWPYIPTRGTRQPLFVAMRREGLKRAFYADATFPTWMPTTAKIGQCWWPDTDNRWDGSMVFVERMT